MSSKDLMLKILKQAHVCSSLCCYPHCFIQVNVTTEIKPGHLVNHSCLHGDGRHFLTVFNIYNVGVPMATNAYTPRALLLATGPAFSTRYLALSKEEKQYNQYGKIGTMIIQISFMKGALSVIVPCAASSLQILMSFNKHATTKAQYDLTMSYLLPLDALYQVVKLVYLINS